jgi:ribulose 1,5-bisphosphate synthetase/thiazole synthase
MAEAGLRETPSTDVLISGTGSSGFAAAIRLTELSYQAALAGIITLWRAPLRRSPKTDNLRRQNRP